MPVTSYSITLPTITYSTGSTTLPQWADFWTNGTTAATSYTVTMDTMVWQNWNTQYVETQEQAEERRRRDAEHRARIRETARRLEEAEAKASALLLSILTVRQRREYRRYGRVTVKAPSGRIFRVQRGVVGNISIMEGDLRRATLCVHPGGNIPVDDVVAGQILAIMHCEEEVIAKANLHGGDWSESELEIRWQARTPRAVAA